VIAVQPDVRRPRIAVEADPGRRIGVVVLVERGVIGNDRDRVECSLIQFEQPTGRSGTVGSADDPGQFLADHHPLARECDAGRNQQQGQQHVSYSHSILPVKSFAHA